MNLVLVAVASAGCALALFPAVAAADPCEGPLPIREGQSFGGQVRYVGDGDSLCVGPSADASTWIEIRLSDFDAPELHGRSGRDARDRLTRLTQGRSLQCVAVRGRNGRVIVYDRVIAACRLNGRTLEPTAVVRAADRSETDDRRRSPSRPPEHRGSRPDRGCRREPTVGGARACGATWPGCLAHGCRVDPHGGRGACVRPPGLILDARSTASLLSGTANGVEGAETW